MQSTEAYQNALIKFRCESDLSFFIRYIFVEYYGVKWVHNWHHDEIIKVIYALERREYANAVINIPPRYGKTEIAVIIWVCWTMIRNPRAQFIHGSYSVDLALKNSSMIRNVLKSDCIQRHWPIKMRDSEDSKGLWLTEQGGGLKADTTAGAITGFGAGITSWVTGDPFDGAIILDDPLKPDDATSEVTRKSVNERLSGTIHSRKNHSKVPILIVMQRLHVDDPTAVAIRGDIMGESFHCLTIPALSSDGTAMWPFKHTSEQLMAMKSSNAEVFSSQYQQEPYIAGGSVFHRDWFGRYDYLPASPTQIIHAWDTAYKAGTHNDPSCCLVWHVLDGKYFLAEVHHGKWDYPELRRRMVDLAARDKPSAILIEDKASGQSLIQEARNMVSSPIIAINPTSDKETRARVEAPAVQAGKVILPHKAGWLLDYENELIAFPKSSHDDRVDATSMFLRYMRENNDDDFAAMLERVYG